MNAELKEILDMLTPKQLEYLSHRIHCQSDKEAAERVGIAQQTMYNWPNKQQVNRAVQLALIERTTTAMELGRKRLESMVPKALAVIETHLQSGRGQIKLKAALEVLNRTGMIPGSAVDITSGGEPLESAVSDERRERLLRESGLADSLFAGVRKETVGLDTESKDTLAT